MAWIFLNNSFLSIVSPNGKRGALLVRARVAGDLEAIFPDARVTETPARDYRFRATIPRDAVAKAVASQVLGIDYKNFKGSVPDTDRHDAYMKVWCTMNGYQMDQIRKSRASLRWNEAEEMDIEPLLPFEDLDPTEAPVSQNRRKARRRP
jgi:hypothetical protein